VAGQVVGPSVIFAGCVVEPGPGSSAASSGPARSSVPAPWWSDSVLMDGCHVAADAKVAGSIMGPQSTVGQRGDVRAGLGPRRRCRGLLGHVVDGERVSG
jgi:NDP-sugar pyrophosphorylase family protein